MKWISSNSTPRWSANILVMRIVIKITIRISQLQNTIYSVMVGVCIWERQRGLGNGVCPLSVEEAMTVSHWFDATVYTTVNVLMYVHVFYVTVMYHVTICDWYASCYTVQPQLSGPHLSGTLIIRTFLRPANILVCMRRGRGWWSSRGCGDSWTMT